MADTSPTNMTDTTDAGEILHAAVSKLTLLERRCIEAGVLVPLIRAFQQAFGEEAANAVARQAIVALAEQQGRENAERKGRNDLLAFSENMQAFSGGGALEIEMVERNEERVGFNVRRCRFAEMYRGMGAGDLGAVLSCNRDFSNVTGFNPAIQLSRTQTIMMGADYCNFRYTAAPDSAEAATTA